VPLRLNHSTASEYVRLRGRTVTEVARHLGLERTFVSRCLSGSRNLPPEQIPALAAFLEVEPFKLLGPEDPRAAVVELARMYEVKPDELEAV
jgi:transcriptional regulator with XRE-family HTH domain